MPFNFKTYADITGQHEMALAAQVGREAAEKDALAASQRQQQIGLQARGQEIQYQTHLDNLMARRFSEERQQQYQMARDLEQREFQRERDEETERRDIGAFERTEKGRIATEGRAEERREEGTRDVQTKEESKSLEKELHPDNYSDEATKKRASDLRKELRKIESDPTLSTPASRIEARQKVIQKIRDEGILNEKRTPSPIAQAITEGHTASASGFVDYLDTQHTASGGEGLSPLITPRQRKDIEDGAELDWTGGRNGLPMTPKFVFPPLSERETHSNAVEIADRKDYSDSMKAYTKLIADTATNLFNTASAGDAPITLSQARLNARDIVGDPPNKPASMIESEEAAVEAAAVEAAEEAAAAEEEAAATEEAEEAAAEEAKYDPSQWQIGTEEYRVASQYTSVQNLNSHSESGKFVGPGGVTVTVEFNKELGQVELKDDTGTVIHEYSDTAEWNAVAVQLAAVLNPEEEPEPEE